MDADADHEVYTFLMECNQISNKVQFLMNPLPNVKIEAVEHLHRQLNAIKVILLDLNNAADGFLRLVKSSSPLRVIVRDGSRDKESAAGSASRVQAFAKSRTRDMVGKGEEMAPQRQAW
ncbi:hypothetical protein K438DRAFT_1780595 [Mycena galopus ATCC 62051]|nr:hypothetical protein K438DRAFT_1780595 [Mycena galopus ATCC 62051]